MTRTIYIIDLESVPTRYTVQWKTGLPQALNEYISQQWADVRVVNISGGDVQQVVTPGAFLNFAGTNAYKAQQCLEITKLFSDGKVKDGDKFLFTDAWNPVILQVKYMVELLGIKAELHGIWHAGSYDPQDFLGRLIQDKRWSNNTERALFHALDKNIFATNFHVKLFHRGVFPDVGFDDWEFSGYKDKVILSGQPHNLLVKHLEEAASVHYPDVEPIKKRNLILFPHRVAPEKQPEIFRDLAKEMPEYEFVVCQDQQLTKDEYHRLLVESKIVFSANLQETLGISAMEAVLVDSIPLLPDRLSYSEMYLDAFKYESKLTESYENYEQWKNIMKTTIRHMIENYDDYYDALQEQKAILLRDYLTAEPMFEALIK